MLLFIIENTAILGLLYLLYKLVLYKNASPGFNRWFLLGAIVVSLSFPLINVDILPSQLSTPKFTSVDLTDSPITQEVPKHIEIGDQNGTGLESDQHEMSLVNDDHFSPSYLLRLFYGLGSILLTVVLTIRLTRLYRLFAKADNTVVKGVSSDTSGRIIGTSFFGKILIGCHIIGSEHFQMVLNHEQIHGTKWHTFDILFAELTKLVIWVNPFIWLIGKEICLNHELETDQIMCRSADQKAYSTSLLALAMPQYATLIHAFARSHISLRIKTLLDNRKHSLRSSWLITSLAFTFLFVVFSCSESHEQPTIHISGIHLKSISTRFIGHQDDLGLKDQKLISVVEFALDGTITKAETYLNYPYNFKQPQPFNFWVNPDGERIVHVMDGLSLDVAENHILYGNEWPMILADITDQGNHPNRKRHKNLSFTPRFDVAIDRRADGMPNFISMEEQAEYAIKSVQNWSVKWSWSYTDSFKYNADGLLSEMKSGYQNGSINGKAASFQYRGKLLTGSENTREGNNHVFAYNESGQLSKVVKYKRGEIMNTRFFHYDKDGRKIQTDFYNRFGEAEYSVKFEYEYY